MIESLKKLQEHILEVGLARSVLALPAPRMLSLASPTSGESGIANVFTLTITEPEISIVSRDLFASGHYSLAVQEAYKALDKYVSDRTGTFKLSGTQLMEQVFSPNSPVLYWSARQSSSEQDEQKGYHRLYSGAMLGIRNPVTHEFNWVDEPEIAIELLVFAQHLLRKAKSAQFDEGIRSTSNTE
ncbi:TIGR02391 family protein [Aminobacter sp. MSH1]|uniref:TIGR02391 family protein n=1 Tax=Aminobacter sp. MSH1 TaxID=374606 RepID=UPI00131F2825|nr:TIGR02391 family protein [Aminobacter sp. MSH1]